MPACHELAAVRAEELGKLTFSPNEGTLPGCGRYVALRLV